MYNLSFETVLQDWTLYNYIWVFFKMGYVFKMISFYRYIMASLILRHTHFQQPTISVNIIGVRWRWPQSWTSPWISCSCQAPFCCFWCRLTSWMFVTTTQQLWRNTTWHLLIYLFILSKKNYRTYFSRVFPSQVRSGLQALARLWFLLHSRASATWQGRAPIKSTGFQHGSASGASWILCI